MPFFQQHINRRSFLGWTLSFALATQVPLKVFGASSPTAAPIERSLSLFHIHTGEYFRDLYWAEGTYLSESLDAINRLFRDYRTGDVKKIDTELLDLINVIQRRTSSKEPIHIVSGYRSHKTNELLRKKGSAVARNSFHLHGKAADITLPHVPLSKLRKMAAKLNVGGVGYYPRSHFVHIDTGPVRFW